MYEIPRVGEASWPAASRAQKKTRERTFCASQVLRTASALSNSTAIEASTATGQQGMFGDTLRVAADETVRLRSVVTGGAGQLLSYYRDGRLQRSVPVLSDPFVHELEVRRAPASEGPLGTFWRIETRDLQARTAIGNPIFLKSP